MASTKPELKVHIVPIGPEEDRAVLPLIRLRAEKVYLVVEKNPHPTLKRFKERIARRIGKEAGLRKEDIITNEYYKDWKDFSGIVSKFSEIAQREQEAGNNVLINISSGSKFASIAGTLVALLYDAEAYYAQAEKYLRLEQTTPDTTGVTDVISIPNYRIEKLDEKWVYALSILRDYPAGIKQMALADKLIEAEKRIGSAKAGKGSLLRACEEKDPKKKLTDSAQNNILRREYITPMHERKLIEIRGQRRGALISLANGGKTALDMFLESNSYWKQDWENAK
jgi:hypothetical protein